LLHNVNLQGKDVPNVASNHCDGSSTREKSVVEIGKLPNVKKVCHAKNTTIDNDTDLKQASLFVFKKSGRNNIYELAWPLFEHIYYINVTV
jgi:hypothetical protein